MSETLSKLSNDKVKVKIIDRGTGAITETNVLLASASNAIINRIQRQAGEKGS